MVSIIFSCTQESLLVLFLLIFPNFSASRFLFLVAITTQQEEEKDNALSCMQLFIFKYFSFAWNPFPESMSLNMENISLALISLPPFSFLICRTNEENGNVANNASFIETVLPILKWTNCSAPSPHKKPSLHISLEFSCYISTFQKCSTFLVDCWMCQVPELFPYQHNPLHDCIACNKLLLLFLSFCFSSRLS